MKDTISKIKEMEPSDKTTVVEGWIRTKRDSKNVCFLEVSDGTCFGGFQVVIDKNNFNDTDLLSSFTTGASVSCTGKIVVSQGGNQKTELAAEDVKLVGPSPLDYPLQKKRHTLEYLREISHLRPRTNAIGATARVRNALAFGVHKFFQENGFFYVNTPIITASDCEGAGEMFQVTTLDLDNVPKTSDGKTDYSTDFFGKKANLTVSGQLSAETYAMALKNVYTFGPTFRAENSVTKKHLAEFWMIEPEMAFCNLQGNMEVAEAFIKYIFSYALERCPDDMDFFSKFVEKGVRETVQSVIDSPFSHMTYTEAIKQLEKSKESFDYPVSWGIDLQTEHERYLTEKVCGRPVFVTDYPKEIKAFYMKLNEDGKTVRGMDLLVPRLGEIIGGSERESDLDTLKGRMKELGLKEQDYWWYLDLRKYGTVPHSGFGLGFARAIQYVTGMQNIRDVIPYPRAVKQADF